MTGYVIEPTIDERPDDADAGVAVIGDVTEVALRGNAPLKHYARAELPLMANRVCGNGFLYALVFPGKTNGMTIGIGTSSSYDLNRQHQPIDVIHYSEVMNVAAQIATGDYMLADGPLTQRFFGDERAYKEQVARGETTNRHETFTRTGIKLDAPALAYTMQKMHRAVWGDPLDEATRITLDEGVTDYDLVVRFDDFLNRVVLGVTPKNAAWLPANSQGLRRLNPDRSVKAEAWEFRELLRFNRRTLAHALARWAEAGAVRLPLRTVFGDFQLSGEALTETLAAMHTEGQLQGWDLTI